MSQIIDYLNFEKLGKFLGYLKKMFAAKSHTHGTSEITNLDTTLASKANKNLSSINDLTATALTTVAYTPGATAIASSPFARDLWHDNFAFLNAGQTIRNHQSTKDGSTWVADETSMKGLFIQKEYEGVTVLPKDLIARRFTISGVAWSSIEWIEIGVAYTSPFSPFEVKIECSSDENTWTVMNTSTITNGTLPYFLKIANLNGNGYIRFTFKKTDSKTYTTGSTVLTCIKGLTKRKGNQGLGIEYEYPYKWNVNKDIYPWTGNSQNLGTSSIKWKSVYATDFYGSFHGNADTATKVNGHTVSSDVPSGAKFTDTNTWRPVVDNLSSDATDQSLSANQGKQLKSLIDSKSASSHKHTKADITDFPTLGTASAKDVAVSGNASTAQVVMGNDTRLTDNRNAKDVYAWAKAAAKPAYTASEVGAATSAQGAKADTAVQSVKIGTKEYKSGTSVTLPAYPTSLPASDVSEWAKASNKPSYTKSEVGLGNVDNTADISKPVSTAQQDAIDLAYANSNKYTDQKIADLIDGAPETMDTLKEVADAIAKNKSTEEALNSAIGTKANQSELDTHTGNATIHITANERTAWNAAKTHADSTHARSDATKVEKSTTNGNIKVNGTETTVYTHPSGTNPHGTTKSDVGLGDVGNFKAVSTVASQKLSDTEKANARANIGAGTSNFDGNYNSLTNKPTIPTVGDGKITIKQGGTEKGSFTVNQNGATTIELTDTNTWRGIQNNLTSTSTTDSLSAAQGKALNDKFGSYVPSTRTVNGKALSGNVTLSASDVGASASGHNHDSTYLKLSGGTVTGATSFTNTTASTSKSTGAVKVSGGVGIAGRMSANEVMIGDGCTLEFDSTNKCVKFVFS